VADWLGYPRALLFGNRYMADLAVVQALLGEPDDVCVQDRLNHPGLIDAARLAGCRLRRYPHLDAGGAMRQLRQSPEGAAMLVTEGVFGMDGDAAPLRALTLVARMQQALTCVDDAGIGVTGPEGRGSVAAAGLGVEDVPLLLVSLGKALGASGAVVAGDDVLIGHLAETARPYLHAAALPPAQTAAALAAVRQARRDAWRRERLHERVAQFRAGAGRAGLTLMPSESPIQPLLGDELPWSPWRPHWSAPASSSRRSVRRRCPKARPACASRCPPCTRPNRCRPCSTHWHMLATRACTVAGQRLIRPSQ
jgi:8-amino-7-oxononanoate synthase